MNFKVIDEHGRLLKAGRNLSQIKAELAKQTQQTLQAMANEGEAVVTDAPQDEITNWCFDALPEIMEIRRQKQTVIGYPALVDQGTYCRIDVFDEPHIARHHHRQGLIRLLRIGLKEQVKFLEKNLPESLKLGVLYMPLGTWEELRAQLIDAAIYQACLHDTWPQSSQAFETAREQAKERVGLLAQELARLVLEILELWADIQKKIVPFKVYTSTYHDIMSQLSGLIHKQFVVQTPYEHLRHFPRYLQAVLVRLDGVRADADRDQTKMKELAPLLANYQRVKVSLAGAPDPALEEYGWMLQELRVALFAQRLRTPYPVSVKRLNKAWQALAR